MPASALIGLPVENGRAKLAEGVRASLILVLD